MDPTEEDSPYTMSVLFEDTDCKGGYGRPRAGVETPGIAIPGVFTESMQTAASKAKEQQLLE